MAALEDAYKLLNSTRGMMRKGPARDAALTYAGGLAGAKAEEIAGSYPVPSRKPLALWYDRVDAQGRPYKSKFKTMKQQRFVMRLAAKGKIPYRRTGRLGASITSEPRIVDTGVIVMVGTNVPYAQYVIGSDPKQSHYHAGTWEPLREKLKENKPEIVQVFANALIYYIRGFIKKK